jgi:hypothetical protein
MAYDKRSIRELSEKVHPLFVELYLKGDTDDDKPVTRGARRRVNALRKQVARRASLA